MQSGRTPIKRNRNLHDRNASLGVANRCREDAREPHQPLKAGKTTIISGYATRWGQPCFFFHGRGLGTYKVLLQKGTSRKLASRLRCSISSLARIACTMDKVRQLESLSTSPWTAANISALIGSGAVAAIIGWQSYDWLREGHLRVFDWPLTAVLFIFTVCTVGIWIWIATSAEDAAKRARNVLDDTGHANQQTVARLRDIVAELRKTGGLAPQQQRQS